MQQKRTGGYTSRRGVFVRPKIDSYVECEHRDRSCENTSDVHHVNQPVAELDTQQTITSLQCENNRHRQQKTYLSPRELVLTHHARRRMQQRGVPAAAIKTILAFGSPHYAGQGCVAYHIDRNAIQKAKRNGYDISRLKNIACIIAQGDVVVTVEHAPKKPKHWARKKGGWIS